MVRGDERAGNADKSSGCNVLCNHKAYSSLSSTSPTVLCSYASMTFSYAPTTNVPCPNGVLVRTFDSQSQLLNTQEIAYITARESGAIPAAWSDWLGNASAIGYSLSSFNHSLPRIGIALGGQGYRTAQFGAGVFSALDARNTTAKSSGTGGLLQVTSYLAGSSGTCTHRVRRVIS